jgi:LPXTG-motif cell wall-anchored protein
VGDVLGDLGSTVTCTAATAAGDVTAAALVAGVASALTQPLTIEALSLAGAGSFSVPAATSGGPAAPGSPGSLPNTGGEAQLALLALGLGAVGLVTRRLVARAA